MRIPSWTKTLHSGPIEMQATARETVAEDVLRGGGPFKVHAGQVDLPGGVRIGFWVDHGRGSVVLEVSGLGKVALGVAQLVLEGKEEGHVLVQLERLEDT